jgi:hypothetical protein
MPRRVKANGAAAVPVARYRGWLLLEMAPVMNTR